MKVNTIIDIYNEILNGQRATFPMNTWNSKHSKSELIKVVRYLILEKLEMSREELLEHAYLEFWSTYKIRGAIRKISKQDTRAFIIECFPEWDIKYWEFKIAKVPANYWNEHTCAEATKWLIEEVLHWDLEKVQTDISNSYFIDNKLNGMLQTLSIGAVEAVVIAYPNYDWTYLKERRGYKITPKQADTIRMQYKNGINMYELAKIYNVNVASIFYVVHNKNFKQKAQHNK